MNPRHVTSLAAIFVCHLLLSCAQSSPNAALLKLIAAKHSRIPAVPPSSSYLGYNPPFPSDTAPDDVNELWLDPVTGTHPSLLRAGNSLTSAGSPTGEAETEDGGVEEGLVEASKRFHPSAFFGSRGKRMFNTYAKRFFHHGFVGSRGKRVLPYLLNGERMGDADEEEEEEEEERARRRMSKRFNPSGFTGSRGKRYIPGLEALLLSQMYKKLDAEKWKRQSLLGFHAARG